MVVTFFAPNLRFLRWFESWLIQLCSFFHTGNLFDHQLWIALLQFPVHRLKLKLAIAPYRYMLTG